MKTSQRLFIRSQARINVRRMYRSNPVLRGLVSVWTRRKRAFYFYQRRDKPVLLFKYRLKLSVLAITLSQPAVSAAQSAQAGISDCHRTISTAYDVGMIEGVILGSVLLFLAQQIISVFVLPPLWELVHRLRVKRGEQCRCPICVEDDIYHTRKQYDIGE